MREKVIDIYPPSKDRENKTREVFHKKNKVGRSLFFSVFFIFVLIFGYFYYSSYKTKVFVYPKIEIFSDEKEVFVKSSGAVGEGEIRGGVFIEKLSETKDFPIEGRKLLEKKTEGEIKVCQSYSDTAVKFVVNTRFCSEEGKMFFAKEGFSLPGKKDNNGCAVVTVVAGDAGEDYNISSESKFSLPGLSQSNLYNDVTGISFLIKEEGFVKEVPYLSEDAVERAEAQMGQDLFERGKETLKEKYKNDYFVESDAQYNFTVKRDDDASQRDVAEDAEMFPFTLELTLKLLAIEKKEVEGFIKNSIFENHTWRKETEDVKIDFSRINFEKEEADVVISFSIDGYEEIDKETLKRDIIGLSFSAAKDKIKEKTDAKKIDIKTVPFGLSSIASSLSRIEILLEFDKN